MGARLPPSPLIPAELLDGIASGLLGVAVPVLAADLTGESGYTRPALRTVSALPGLFGGMLVGSMGWTAAFLGPAVPGAITFALALWVAKAAADTATDAASHLQDSQAR